MWLDDWTQSIVDLMISNSNHSKFAVVVVVAVVVAAAAEDEADSKIAAQCLNDSSLVDNSS